MLIAKQKVLSHLSVSIYRLCAYNIQTTSAGKNMRDRKTANAGKEEQCEENQIPLGWEIRGEGEKASRSSGLTL